jgi:hypothetical protein
MKSRFNGGKPMTVELNDKQIRCLWNLLDHYHDEEQAHYESCYPPPRKHIYRSIVTLKNLLEKETPARTVEIDEGLDEEVLPCGRHDQPSAS